MARIRSIKPEFWQDEQMGSLPCQVRLLFIGLWSMADDEGRFRANPLFVRSQVFPYDSDIDVGGGLDQLARLGRVVLYAADGQRYGWIRNFTKHQRIEKPKPSPLPAPPDTSWMHPGLVRDEPGTTPGALPAGGEGSGKEQGAEGRGEDPAPAAPVEVPVQAALLESVERRNPTPEQLQAAWNELRSPEMPAWQGMDGDRRAKAKKRLEERPLSAWREIICRVANSPFCRGENERGWRADPDFLLKPGTAQKVLEGKYDRRGTGPPAIGSAAEKCLVPGCSNPGDVVSAHAEGAWWCYPHLGAFQAQTNVLDVDLGKRADVIAAWLRTLTAPRRELHS